MIQIHQWTMLKVITVWTLLRRASTISARTDEWMSTLLTFLTSWNWYAVRAYRCQGVWDMSCLLSQFQKTVLGWSSLHTAEFMIRHCYKSHFICLLLSVREYASFGRSENNGLRHQPFSKHTKWRTRERKEYWQKFSFILVSSSLLFVFSLLWIGKYLEDKE